LINATFKKDFNGKKIIGDKRLMEVLPEMELQEMVWNGLFNAPTIWRIELN